MNTSGLIEKYIQKKTTAQEQAEVKRLLAEDPEFKKELLFQLELMEAVKKEENQQLKKRLQVLEKGEKSKALLPVLWKIAAVFVIGFGLLWFFNPSSDYEKLYAENFEVYPNIIAPTVRDINTSENAIQKAFNYYDSKNYKQAITAFEELYTTEKVGYANFYYAVSLMADKQVEKAVKALENPNWKIPEKYQVQTNWYLALCYLKLENKEKVIVYLEKVANSNKLLGRKAKEILKVLRSKE